MAGTPQSSKNTNDFEACHTGTTTLDHPAAGCETKMPTALQFEFSELLKADAEASRDIAENPGSGHGEGLFSSYSLAGNP